MAAFALSRYEFRFRETWYLVFAIGLLFPANVASLPIYLLLRHINLLDNPFGVALPEAAFSLPFTIIILRPFMRAIPDELQDAAVVDGASRHGGDLRVHGTLDAARAGVLRAGPAADCRRPVRAGGFGQRLRSAGLLACWPAGLLILGGHLACRSSACRTARISARGRRAGRLLRLLDQAVAAARAHQDEPSFTEVDAGIQHADVFDVTFPGYGGDPIKGWLLQPHRRLRAPPSSLSSSATAAAAGCRSTG